MYWIEDQPIGMGRLGIMARPRGGEWLGDELRTLRSAGVDVVVSLLTEAEARELDLAGEPQACAAHGIVFRSLPILDRQVPSQTGALCRLLDELAAMRKGGKSIVVHCRMGIGRSSLVAACLLAHAGVPVGEAFERIQAARGCSVPDVPEQRRWAEQFPQRYREYQEAQS